MTALKTLISKCKFGVYLTVNEHRDSRETALQRLGWYDELECPPAIEDDVRAGILSSGVIVDLQFYPDTPIGSFHIVHYDIDDALMMALECIGGMPSDRAGSHEVTLHGGEFFDLSPIKTK